MATTLSNGAIRGIFTDAKPARPVVQLINAKAVLQADGSGEKGEGGDLGRRRVWRRSAHVDRRGESGRRQNRGERRSVPQELHGEPAGQDEDLHRPRLRTHGRAGREGWRACELGGGSGAASGRAGGDGGGRGGPVVDDAWQTRGRQRCDAGDERREPPRAGDGGAGAHGVPPMGGTPQVLGRPVPIEALNPYNSKWTIKATVISKGEVRRINTRAGEMPVFDFASRRLG